MLKGVIDIIATYIAMSFAAGVFAAVKVIIDIKINGITDDEFFGSIENILAVA